MYCQDLCPSPNVELMHAKLVLQLHRTHYFCEEPFEIPPQSTKNIFYYDTPVRNNAPSTPSTRTTCVPSSVSSSPVKSSPIKEDVIVVPIVCTRTCSELTSDFTVPTSHQPNCVTLHDYTPTILQRTRSEFMLNITWIMRHSLILTFRDTTPRPLSKSHWNKCRLLQQNDLDQIRWRIRPGRIFATPLILPQNPPRQQIPDIDLLGFEMKNPNLKGLPFLTSGAFLSCLSLHLELYRQSLTEANVKNGNG